MAKESTVKKNKKKIAKDALVVHDIINKVRETQRQVDKKLEEISLICSSKQCKVK
jgi:hypothetical protein